MSYFPTAKHTYANVTVPNGATLTGGGGITYTTGTTSASNWGATNITLDSYYNKKPKVEITDTDLVIDGLSLKGFMRSVQEELLIPGKLNRNTELEQEFNELKECADRYVELERKFLEQKRIWETLKTTDR